MLKLNRLHFGLTVSVLMLGAIFTAITALFGSSPEAAFTSPDLEQALWSESCDPINDYSGCRGS